MLPSTKSKHHHVHSAGSCQRTLCKGILDDFSRYIIACKLCTTMRAGDVTETLTLAFEASSCDRAEVVHKPRLLSDNGSSYIAGDLADWLEEQGMDHVRGAPITLRPKARSSAGIRP